MMGSMRQEMRDFVWVDWSGRGEQPPATALLEVLYSDGLQSRAIRAGKLRWTREGLPDDIVGYRVLSYE